MLRFSSLPATFLSRLNSLAPESVFLFVAGIFGFACAAITPPIQVPDEPAHWMRVYQFSQGILLADHGGGQIPVSFVETIGKFAALPFNPDQRTTFGTIGREFHRPLEARTTVFKDFTNTSLYSPVPYLPQILLTAGARKLVWSPIAILYAGRAGTVLAYLLIGWATIRCTPVLKWPACMILTGPTALFLCGSVSADSMTMGLAFLATAMVLRCVCQPVSLKLTIGLSVVLMALTLCKSAYFPIAFFVFSVPLTRWPGNSRWIVPVLIVLSCIGLLAIWLALSQFHQVKELGDGPDKQLQWIMHHPVSYARNFCQTLSTRAFSLLYQEFGVLGWLDTPLQVTIVELYVICLGWVTLCYGEKISLAIWPRVVAAAVIAATIVVVVTGNYLVWDKVGQAPIQGLQGRYFLPISLLAAAVFSRRGRYPVQPRWMVAMLSCFAIYTIWALVHRYYFPGFGRL